MSISAALFSGVTALSANSQAIATISQNIANMNTVGFKQTITRFETLVTDGDASTANSSGSVLARPLQLINEQGLLQSTQRATDVGISGNGFFVVADGTQPGVEDRFLYTRNGQFQVDQDGFLTNSAGFFLQGWPTLSNGDFDIDQNGIADSGQPDPSDLANLKTARVNTLSSAATPTKIVDMSMNVPATAAIGDTFPFSTRIFDALGLAHSLDLVWEKTAEGPATWDLEVQGITRADDGSASTTGLTYPMRIDTVVFNGDGSPASFDPQPLTIDTANWIAGASTSTIVFDIGTAGKVDGISQFAAKFEISDVNPDGATFGTFRAIEFGEDGLVTALFDNGKRLSFMRLPLGTFPNTNGLQPVDGGAWAETNTSGNHLLKVAGSGTAGTLSPGSLESSTVDLSEEFSNMIIHQRAFSAGTRVISTADQMLEELVRVIT